MAIVGIDLGTTNSAIAYLKNGKPEIIENKKGSRTTPSVVQKDLKGEIIIGEDAKSGIKSLPDRTVLEVKRLMGTEERVSIGEKELRPEEVSALILKYLKESVEERLGEAVTEAVITVPAYFSDSQRKATQKAGEIAGLKVERIINEPTAAAIAYGFENSDQNQHILVYDLGGGTFDVSIIEIFEGVVEVKASAGNNKLGGMDFDNAIVDWVVKEYEMIHGIHLYQIEGKSEQEVRLLLKEEAERVKKSLSNQMSVRFMVPFVGIHNGAPVTIDMELSRGQFEQLIQKLAASTLHEVDTALKESNLSLTSIDQILLVGGSTRIPYIQKIVEEKLQRPIRKDINPDEVVALGAAVQAGIKSGAIDSTDGLMVLDICSYTLGTDIVKNVGGQFIGGYFDPIINKGAKVPVTEKKTYYTMSDYQDQVIIQVYQGENEKVFENTKLNKDDIILEGIPKQLAGHEEIEIQFTYDINGILQIEATIVSTGKKITEVINSQVGVMDEREMTQAKVRLEKDWAESEYFEDVKKTLYRAEKLMQDVGEQEKQKLQETVSNLKVALSRNDRISIQKYDEELTDLLIEFV
ncbi:Hsp70 family protein [Bacillus wiedmannii]|uniref:Hsp70 family protein n=1 Tax=Bacillus wiedmannii TaxID=1890302 RepID=UPI003F90D943